MSVMLLGVHRVVAVLVLDANMTDSDAVFGGMTSAILRARSGVNKLLNTVCNMLSSVLRFFNMNKLFMVDIMLHLIFTLLLRRGLASVITCISYIVALVFPAVLHAPKIHHAGAAQLLQHLQDAAARATRLRAEGAAEQEAAEQRSSGAAEQRAARHAERRHHLWRDGHHHHHFRLHGASRLPSSPPHAFASAHSTSAGFGRACVSEAFAVLARACMHHRYATSAHARLRAPLTDMHASGSARSLARGISRYVPHTRFFLCGYYLASLLARGVRGAVHASAPSRKSPTELEDRAGGPAANAEG